MIKKIAFIVTGFVAVYITGSLAGRGAAAIIEEWDD